MWPDLGATDFDLAHNNFMPSTIQICEGVTKWAQSVIYWQTDRLIDNKNTVYGPP